MKKTLMLLFLCGLAAIFVFGCKSEPEPVQEEPAPAPVETVAPVADEPVLIDDALTALREEVSQLRASLLTSGFNTKNETLWNNGETAFQSAESSFGKNYDSAKTGYETARDSFIELVKEGLAQVAQSLENAKHDAVDSGAAKRFPDAFAGIVARHEDLIQAGAEENPEKSINEANAVLNGYNAMTAYMLADSLKKRIETMELFELYADEYAAGCASLTESESLFPNDTAASFTATQKAVEIFGGIIDAWFKKCADIESQKIASLVLACEELKAPVAVKDGYAEAEAALGISRQLYAGKSYEASFNAMRDAADKFAIVYGQAVIKRDAAVQAMEQAKNRQDSATALAAIADERIPLTGEDEPEIPLPGEELIIQPAPTVDTPAKTNSSDDGVPITETDEAITNEISTDEPVINEISADEPTTDEPVINEISTEEPVINEISTEEPVINEISTEETTTDEPVINEISTEETTTDEAVINEISTEETATDEPVIKEISTEETTTDEADTNEISTDEPVTNEISTEETTTDEPVINEISADEPTTDEPVTNEISTEETTTDEPVIKEISTEQTATDEPVTNEISTDEPATDEPVINEISIEETTTDEADTNETVTSTTGKEGAAE